MYLQTRGNSSDSFSNVIGSEKRAHWEKHVACQQDGAFMVRTSETGGIQFPYVLCVIYRGKQFNIQVGLRGIDPTIFSLGSEKENEWVWLELLFHALPR